jgi:hypothetical protein
MKGERVETHRGAAHLAGNGSGSFGRGNRAPGRRVAFLRPAALISGLPKILRLEREYGETIEP